MNFDNDFTYVSPFTLNLDGDMFVDLYGNRSSRNRMEKWAVGGLMRNLLKGVADDAPPEVPQKFTLHCQSWKLMFMHGGLMANTVVQYMESGGHTNCNGNVNFTEVTADNTCIDFIPGVDVLFQNYINGNEDNAQLRDLLGYGSSGILGKKSRD